MLFYSTRLLVLYALFATVAWATNVPRLVPSRRADFLVSRGLDHVIPKQHALLSYSSAPHHPPAATVAFVAYPNRPILLLEDIDYFVEDIVCSSIPPDTNILTVRFADEDAFEAAAENWSQLDEFIILTAHYGCNPYTHRGSWRATTVIIDNANLIITLPVDPISMKEVGRSFSVRYDHTGGSHDLFARNELMKRDNHSFDDAWTFGYSPNISERMTLFPLSGLAGTLASDILTKLDDANFNLACVGCSLNTNVSLGLNFDIEIGNASCAVNSNQSCFTLNQAAMNLTVLSMDLTAALEVALGKEVTASANYTILRVPVAPELSVPGLISLSPAIGLGVDFSLDIASSINFTYGATGHVPSGAFASVSIIDDTGKFNPAVKAGGWDGSGVDQIPFRVNDGQFTITTGLSFAPFAEVPFTILNTGAVLRLTQNLPQVSATASLHSSVSRTCNATGPDDYESFQTAFLVGAGMEISTVAELLLEKGIFSSQDIPDSWSYTLFSHDIPLAPTLGANTSTCFVLSDDGIHANTTVNTTSSAAAKLFDQALPGVPAATGTMFPAASAVPTWDMPKIESYYSANGHLPTNVNYEQMVKATTVPTDIQAAVSSAAVVQATPSHKSGAAPVGIGMAGVGMVSVWIAVVGGVGVGVGLVFV